MISVSGLKIHLDTGNISNTPVLSLKCSEIGQTIGNYLPVNNSKYSEGIGNIQKYSKLFRIISIEIPEVNGRIDKWAR